LLKSNLKSDFTFCKTYFSTDFSVESVENYQFQAGFSSNSVENFVENVKNGFIIGFSTVERNVTFHPFPAF